MEAIGLLPRVVVDYQKIPMRDGIWLAADVTRADDNKPHAILLVRTPYSRAEVAAIVDAVNLARTGWVVIVQNVRGRYESQGRFNPFLQEEKDGADTVAWCCAQPWSDGRVVMTGASYAGATQWSCAKAKPRGLKAINPQITATDIRDAWFYEGESFRQAFVQSWALSLVFTDESNRDEIRSRAHLLAENPQQLYNAPPAQSPLTELFPPYNRWIDRADEAYWRACAAMPIDEPLDIPAYHLAGWYDIFCEGSLADFIAMRQRAQSEYARANQRLVVGPWTHTSLYSQQAGEVDHGLQANGFVQDEFGKIISWMGQIINGEPAEGGSQVFVLGSNAWYELSAWPPEAKSQRLYICASRNANGRQGGGRLSWDAIESTGKDGFRHDPSRPVPSTGGRTLDPTLPAAGPLDQSVVENRNDVLVYTSDILEQDLTVMGMVRARIVFATSGQSADLSITLVDVYPDGRARYVVGSMQRADFSPGHSKPVEVRIGSTAITFKRGHRIRIDVASSNFPHLDLNPSTGEPSTKTIFFEAADQVVYWGGRAESFIELPIVDLKNI